MRGGTADNHWPRNKRDENNPRNKRDKDNPQNKRDEDNPRNKKDEDNLRFNPRNKRDKTIPGIEVRSKKMKETDMMDRYRPNTIPNLPFVLLILRRY